MGILDIFTKPLFWLFMGALYTFIFYSATIWAKDMNIQMNKWKWILAAAWFFFLSITIAGGFTLIGENEVRPGLYFLGFFLVVNIILGAVLRKILVGKQKKNV